MLQQTQAERVVGYYRAFLRAFPSPARVCPGPPGRRGAALVRSGLQPPGAQPAPGGRGDPRRARRRRPRRRAGPARAARRGAVHRPGGAVVRLRGRRGDGGHQRAAGTGARRGRGGGDDAARPSPWPTGCFPPDGRGSSTRPCSIWVPRCAPRPARRAALCPLRRQCRWKRRGLTDPDPWRGSSLGAHAGPLCRIRPSGPGPSGPRPAPGHGVPDRWLASACGWPDDPARAQRITAALVAEGFAEWTSGPAGRVLRLR